MECARAEFALSAREGDGATLRTHLQRLAVNKGKADPRLHIDWPKAGRPIWNVFQSLGRPQAMSGLAQIPQTEIRAWMDNNGVKLTPWELDMIAAFDRAAIEFANENARKATK